MFQVVLKDNTDARPEIAAAAGNGVGGMTDTLLYFEKLELQKAEVMVGVELVQDGLVANALEGCWGGWRCTWRKLWLYQIMMGLFIIIMILVFQRSNGFDTLWNNNNNNNN